MLLYSTRGFVEAGLLDAAAVPVLVAIRRHNPLLYDFVLKRSLRLNGKGLAKGVFETRRVEFVASGRDGRPGTALREDYVVRSPHAGLLWVYRHRSAGEPAWFL